MEFDKRVDAWAKQMWEALPSGVYTYTGIPCTWADAPSEAKTRLRVVAGRLCKEAGLEPYERIRR